MSPGVRRRALGRRATAALRALLLRLPWVGRVRGPLKVLPFRGFAGRHRVCLPGRVAGWSPAKEARRAAPGDPRRGMARRLRDAWSLLVSRNVPRARVRLSFGGTVHDVTGDDHGVFLACFDVAEAPAEPEWQRFGMRILSPAPAGSETEAEGDVFVVSPRARRVVVSDIDDTVLYTGVAHKLLMLWNLFATGAEAKVPFPGIAPFYRGLHAGPSGDEANPLLYVSRGPWSIYPILDEFFQRHDIPVGPVLLLREWGVSLTHPYPRRAESHKRELIEHILAVYPELPVVLVGDSGQHDPEIYRGVVHDHPGRVEAIYIRDLAPGGDRSRAIEALRRELAGTGTDLILARSTEQMAVHAAERGWIPRPSLAEIVRHAAGHEA